MNVFAVERHGFVVEQSSYDGHDLAHHPKWSAAIDADLLSQGIPPGTDSENDATRSQVVEGGESGGQSRGVATPAVDDSTPDLDALGDAGESGHGHRRFSYQTALGLPHGIETLALGVTGELHAFADPVSILEINGNGLVHGRGVPL